MSPNTMIARVLFWFLELLTSEPLINLFPEKNFNVYNLLISNIQWSFFKMSIGIRPKNFKY